MIKEWTFIYPAGIDTLTQMPELDNELDDTRVSQIHAVRDVAILLEERLGSDLLEPGTIYKRVADLEDANSHAFHDDQSGEIQALTAKVVPNDTDVVIIEDSAAGWAKKKVALSAIGTGGGSGGSVVMANDTLTSTGSETELVLSADPVAAVGMACGYALMVFHNGKSMAYSASPSEVDEFSFTIGSRTVSFQASGEADEYIAIYFTSSIDGQSDPHAIHDNVAEEILAVSEKASVVDDDLILIEDSAAGHIKRRVKISSLPVGNDELIRVTASDTTSNYLNSKISVSNGIQKSTLNPSGNESLLLRPIYGTSLNTICQGNDSRLSNSRTPTVHGLSSSLHSDTTLAGLNAKISDATLDDINDPRTDPAAVHIDVQNEINGIDLKATPHENDILIIEDSEDEVAPGYGKKKITIGSLPGGAGTDEDAIHDNVKNEINSVTLKETPHINDVILIEDSEDEVAPGYAKKKVTIGSLPFGGGTDPDAIHLSEQNEINTLTLKGTPNGNDVLVIEDSEAEGSPGYTKAKITVNSISGSVAPLTTKGDLYTRDASANTRLGAGADGQFLAVDSAESTGLKWVNAPSGTSPLTTKGDIFGYDTANARIPVGTDGKVLTADSAQAAGVAWQDPPGGGAVVATDTLISTGTETSMVLSDDPLSSPATDVGYALIVFRNGKKMTYNSSPADVDDFSFTQATKTVNFLASGEVDEYVAVYFVLSISGTDGTAIHDDVAGEIHAVTLKGTPDDADEVIIEDSADSWNKKRASLSSIVTAASSPLTTKGDLFGYGAANARVPIGDNGQVLTADSTEALGLKWADAPDPLPLTTKGDLVGYGTSADRLAVGDDGQILTADSAQALGVKWADAPDGSPLTTKGDLYTFGTDNDRLAVGSDGNVLTADSNESLGVKWAAPSVPDHPHLIYKYDYQATGTSGTSWVSWLSERFVIDADHIPSKWIFHVTGWCEGGYSDTGQARLTMGADTLILSFAGETEYFAKGEITTITETGDELIDFLVDYRSLTGGGDTVYIRYVAVYAVY